MLPDKWKMFVAPMSSADRNALWPASFNAHGKVTPLDRGYGAAAIINVDGVDHYAVCYANIHLAGEDLRNHRGLSRHFGGVTSSGKGGDAIPGKPLPSNLATRAEAAKSDTISKLTHEVKATGSAETEDADKDF